jgi:hypothetical protein
MTYGFRDLNFKDHTPQEYFQVAKLYGVSNHTKVLQDVKKLHHDGKMHIVGGLELTLLHYLKNELNVPVNQINMILHLNRKLTKYEAQDFERIRSGEKVSLPIFRAHPELLPLVQNS